LQEFFSNAPAPVFNDKMSAEEAWLAAEGCFRHLQYIFTFLNECRAFEILRTYQVSAPYTLLPTPDTLHPTPYTLHPTSYTLHPTPYTLLTTPFTLRPTPSTRDSYPSSLNAKPELNPNAS